MLLKHDKYLYKSANKLLTQMALAVTLSPDRFTESVRIRYRRKTRFTES